MQKKLVLLACILTIFNTHSISANTSVDSWYRTGYHYSQRGHNKDAFMWMMRAAKAGHAAAQNNIGLSYLYGLGVNKDEKEAFKWFEKAAKQGLSHAQSELAMLYYRQGDTEKAQQWWLMAAELNDEYAQFNLASLLLEKNHLKQAIYWFQKAKHNKHPKAQEALSKLRGKESENVK